MLPLHPVRQREGKIGPQPKGEEQEIDDDDEMIYRDMVKGLLRMNLLNRLRYCSVIVIDQSIIWINLYYLRYILEVVKIPAVVVPILEILTSMARHSMAVATEIFEVCNTFNCRNVLFLY